MEDVFEKALRLLGERLLEKYGCEAEILITKAPPEEASPSPESPAPRAVISPVPAGPADSKAVP